MHGKRDGCFGGNVLRVERPWKFLINIRVYEAGTWLCVTPYRTGSPTDRTTPNERHVEPTGCRTDYLSIMVLHEIKLRTERYRVSYQDTPDIKHVITGLSNKNNIIITYTVF